MRRMVSKMFKWFSRVFKKNKKGTYLLRVDDGRFVKAQDTKEVVKHFEDGKLVVLLSEAEY